MVDCGGKVAWRRLVPLTLALSLLGRGDSGLLLTSGCYADYFVHGGVVVFGEELSPVAAWGGETAVGDYVEAGVAAVYDLSPMRLAAGGLDDLAGAGDGSEFGLDPDLVCRLAGRLDAEYQVTPGYAADDADGRGEIVAKSQVYVLVGDCGVPAEWGVSGRPVMMVAFDDVQAR